MLNKKSLGTALIVFGVLIMIFMLAADPLGIGTTEHGFGLKQKLGMIVGAMSVTAGLILRFKFNK